MKLALDSAQDPVILSDRHNIHTITQYFFFILCYHDLVQSKMIQKLILFFSK